MSKLFALIGLVFAVFVLSACGGTDLGDQWRNSQNPIQKIDRAIVTDNRSNAAAPNLEHGQSALNGQSRDDSGKVCLSDLMVIVTYTDNNGVNRSATACKSADELATCDKIKGVWTFKNNGVFCVIPQANGLRIFNTDLENVLIVVLAAFFGLTLLKWVVGLLAAIGLFIGKKVFKSAEVENKPSLVASTRNANLNPGNARRTRNW